jgi:non-specific serine/threonine protein kinase
MEIDEPLIDYLDSLYLEDAEKGQNLYDKKSEGIFIKKVDGRKIILNVPGDRNIRKNYTVTFSFDKDEDFADPQCNCSDLNEDCDNYLDCKHCVAAALYLTENELPVDERGQIIIAGKGDKKSANHKTIHQQNSSGVKKTFFPEENLTGFVMGYLFNFSKEQLLHFSLQPLIVFRKNGKLSFEKVTASKRENPGYLKVIPEEQFLRFDPLSDDCMKQYLITEGYTNLSVYNVWQQHLNDSQTEVLREYYHGKLKQLWPFLLQQKNIFRLAPEKAFNPTNIKPLELGTTHPSLSFKVTRDERSITIQLNFIIEGKTLSVEAHPGISYLFIIKNKKYYLLEDYDHVKLLQQFSAGFLKFPIAQQFDVLRNLIQPLQDKYPVELDSHLKFESRKADALPQIMVAEYLNQYLMLIPQFIYEGNMVDYGDEPDIVVKNNDDFYLIERDKEAEKKFYDSLRLLHPSFSKQLLKPFYYLPFADVMKGNWFLKTIRKLQDQNTTVKGMQELKKFRYNSAIPTWNMKTSSATDWFDLKIAVSFGTQKVLLRDIQKAIKSDQKVVVLGDGSLGLLPEEWLRQYGMVMKMGEEKDGTLRVNKALFTIINDLHSLINEEDILKELKEKKQRLLNVEKLQMLPVSKKIEAVLRPYQLSGFNWMQSLEELNWGGCLADDMGLGKTLQAICFLQYLKEKYPKATSLVVCPTSLIYNWESEFQKFAPSIKYHIYYGSNRNFSDEDLENYDIIITSYGNMRNDIHDLQKHQFQYVILDESQNIKNPDALVTKAAQLLKAKNRIILSGTPVQNNTFDLYAQMHFLNPGFLGNKEFFKNEFATPIDKNGNSEVAQQLRKMIYPFILRRTKEKVATDLPDKTETILWCQMNKEQRAVYDDYKNYYRHQLLNKIDESGIANTTIYILEGLLRLRQICDSPVLVKDPEVTTTSSIKIEELLREVLENTGSHKLLIFSQFTQMLSLIKGEFEKQNITHLYLDGSTPAGKRKTLVNQFQKDPQIKAFLISLKAGGVGLNLTAADYVYIVDPWWNPAAEDQAIDRTHRIGQAQKVFAYKMICKDTVEEKILQLQQKKKSLFKELISEEKSFVKQLTKGDVQFLFS